jgi:hypothetical protein
MHIHGSFRTYFGFGCWLNNVSFNSIPVSYDASRYAGIRFWAKGDKPLRVAVQMPATEPTKYGGTCAASACVVNGHGPFGISSTAWTEIAIPFSQLKGSEVPFQASSIWSIEFGLYDDTGTQSGSFDLWIDDLTFY